MKKLFLLLFFLVSRTAFSQDVKVVSFSELDELFKKQNDTVYVFNFWATWCGPCVKELPNFDKLQQTYKDEKIKVILVSIDFKSKLKSTLIPFLRKNKISSSVMLLDETNAGFYIDKVSPDWSGTIPATLVINSSKGIRKLYEQEFNYKELENVYLKLK